MWPPCSLDDEQKLVLVWDLDETLLIFNSLLSGAWAAAHGCTGAATLELAAAGRRMQEALLGLCDRHFFFAQLEEYDHWQTSLQDCLQHDDGASLAGYVWDGDGFPPAATAAAAGAPPPAAAAAAKDAPVRSTSLDGASLTKLAYRYRRIHKLHSFGLAALGTTAQRQEWEVRPRGYRLELSRLLLSTHSSVCSLAVAAATDPSLHLSLYSLNAFPPAETLPRHRPPHRRLADPRERAAG